MSDEILDVVINHHASPLGRGQGWVESGLKPAVGVATEPAMSLSKGRFNVLFLI